MIGLSQSIHTQPKPNQRPRGGLVAPEGNETMPTPRATRLAELREEREMMQRVYDDEWNHEADTTKTEQALDEIEQEIKDLESIAQHPITGSIFTP